MDDARDRLPRVARTLKWAVSMKTCPACGGGLIDGRDEVPAVGSDLPDGAPAKGEVSRCRACGYAEYVIRTLEELPAVVAAPVFCDPARLIHIRIGNLRPHGDD